MTDLSRVEILLHLAAIVVYGLTAMSAIAGVVLSRENLMKLALRVAWLGFAVHTFALIARWVASGHGPYVSRYEVLSANAWVVVAVYLLWRRSAEWIRPFSALVFPSVLLLLGIGVYTGPEVSALPPTFSGIWLALHVAFYLLAFSVSLMAALVAVVLVFDERLGRFRERFAPAEALDSASYRLAGLAFAFWGIGMLTGSIWAYYSWGRFWGWDPVETWSLVTWVVYGLYLHLRRLYQWKGRRAAWLLLGCFGLAVGTLFFTSLINGSLHAVYFR